jgi:SAM-dependent methyltransferase
VVEVGSGSADLLADLVTREPGMLGVALDRDATAARLVGGSGLIALRGDALRLPLADGTVDFVLAAKFAHHFHGAELLALLNELARVARGRVVVVDIRRHWLAYWGFVVWSRVFTRNRLVRHDGPLSVLRGFTPGELRELVAPIAGFEWQVRRALGFQLVVVGRRVGV